MKYKCIKALDIPILDEDWFKETDEFISVEVGQIWTRDDAVNNIGGEVHLDNEDGCWIEISFESLKKFFEPID